MNKSNSNNSSKRFKSPVLQHSITIVRPDRPLISRKREDSESEFEEELPPVVETEDMLSSVLGKFRLKFKNDFTSNKLIILFQIY